MSRFRYVLWLEWEEFYAPPGPSAAVFRKREVLDANAEARRKGIAPGMRAPQVRSLHRECKLLNWNPDDFQAKSESWLKRCLPFSGRIEVLDQHCAAVDLSGHPQPIDIAHRLVGALERQPFGVLKYGAGPSKWVAQLAATQGDLLVAPKGPGEFLAPMPISALWSIEPQSRQRLEFLGYRTIGEVAALPQAVLKGQFGALGSEIAQAARGQGGMPLRPNYPEASLREVFCFASSVDDVQTLERTLKLLAERLSSRLDGRQSGYLRLTLEWASGLRSPFARRFTRPLYDLATLHAALRALFAGVEFKEEVASLAITLEKLEPAQARQMAIPVVNQKDGSAVSGAIDGLRATFGTHSVLLASEKAVPRRELVLREIRRATGWY